MILEPFLSNLGTEDKREALEVFRLVRMSLQSILRNKIKIKNQKKILIFIFYLFLIPIFNLSIFILSTYFFSCIFDFIFFDFLIFLIFFLHFFDFFLNLLVFSVPSHVRVEKCQCKEWIFVCLPVHYLIMGWPNHMCFVSTVRFYVSLMIPRSARRRRKYWRTTLFRRFDIVIISCRLTCSTHVFFCFIP